ILFANEEELLALYQVDDLDAGLDAVQGVCEIAAVTCGRRGSIILTPDERIPIETHEVPKRVDTTGAGDLYAAGFLYGWSQGRSLADSGRLGSIAGAAVIGHIGPRPGLSLAQLLHLLDE